MKAQLYFSNLLYNRSLADFFCRDEVINNVRQLINRAVDMGPDKVLELLYEKTEDMDFEIVHEKFLDDSVEELADFFGIEITTSADDDEMLDMALQYIRENKTWTDAEEEQALNTINHLKCGIAQANSKICSDIRDLMDDWSTDNNISQDWWQEFTDEDDIFLKL